MCVREIVGDQEKDAHVNIRAGFMHPPHQPHTKKVRQRQSENALLSNDALLSTCVTCLGLKRCLT